jgi:hypothetical protein
MYVLTSLHTYLGYERSHDGAVPEVEDVEAAAGGRVDAVPAVLGAEAAPLRDGPAKEGLTLFVLFESTAMPL